jgi:hypothetical protein
VGLLRRWARVLAGRPPRRERWPSPELDKYNYDGRRRARALSLAFIILITIVEHQCWTIWGRRLIVCVCVCVCVSSCLPPGPARRPPLLPTR